MITLLSPESQLVGEEMSSEWSPRLMPSGASGYTQTCHRSTLRINGNHLTRIRCKTAVKSVSLCDRARMIMIVIISASHTGMATREKFTPIAAVTRLWRQLWIVASAADEKKIYVSGCGLSGGLWWPFYPVVNTCSVAVIAFHASDEQWLFFNWDVDHMKYLSATSFLNVCEFTILSHLAAYRCYYAVRPSVCL